MRNEYRRQDFSILERGKFYSEAATEKAANGGCSNPLLKEIEMNTQEIIALTLKLKPHERLQVIEKIHESFDRPDPEIERLWGEEAVRRLANFEAGRSKTYSAEEVFGKD
jgi:putative addiction module component (TIGR02574 family)